MNELSKGTKVTLLNGGYVMVEKELGRGGQGIVYLVDCNGKQKALKWYSKTPDDNFYSNLCENARKGSPSEVFLWPEAITERQNGSYGYIMALRPSDYYDFGQFLLAKVHFSSYKALLNAALKICDGFRKLHLNGYSYQDLNDGNFFINPKTGDALICDNDNVVPEGCESGIKGKVRYMAPEVVAGGTPNKYSDRFSLSVILFMLFYANHPFEGAKVAECPCMTEEYEKKFFGNEALFIYSREDDSNRPVSGIHTNVIRRWPVFPTLLQETFIQEFSEEKLKNPKERMLEQGWEKIICSLRDVLVVCPNCGEETFIDVRNSEYCCMNCKKSIPIFHTLNVDNRKLFLTKGTKLHIDDGISDIQVSSDPEGSNLLLLENSSDETWIAETPSGKLKEVAHGKFMPVKDGIKVLFGGKCKEAKIVNIA